jgi:hypothetical protein
VDCCVIYLAGLIVRRASTSVKWVPLCVAPLCLNSPDQPNRSHRLANIPHDGSLSVLLHTGWRVVQSPHKTPCYACEEEWWVVPWLRQLIAGLSPGSRRFAPGSVHVEFVVDKVVLGQFSLRVLRFSRQCYSIGAPYSYVIWGINNRSFGGRSSET